MASISNESGGRKTIQFFGTDGKRRSIRLGKVSISNAQTIKTKVEDLAASKINGLSMSTETSIWLRQIGDQLHDKLARVKLVDPRQKSTLGPFLDEYIASRTDVRPSTMSVYKLTRLNLIQKFGEHRDLRDVTEGDAEGWQRWLRSNKKLAVATASRRARCAKQFFSVAKKNRLIRDNPFAILKCGNESNPERQYFVTRDEIQKVMAVAPDHEWQMIIALARFGGLRTPSETLALQWCDVDWEGQSMLIRSQKTKHLSGSETRTIPIFPELRPYLEKCRQKSSPDAKYVIETYRRESVIGHGLRPLILKCGLKPWPKLFQNMRATRETELANEFPIQVVCNWIGNTQAVALKHYLQVTSEHFKMAVSKSVHDAVHDEDSCGPLEAGEDEENTMICDISAESGQSQDATMAVAGFLQPDTGNDLGQSYRKSGALDWSNLTSIQRQIIAAIAAGDFSIGEHGEVLLHSPSVINSRSESDHSIS